MVSTTTMEGNWRVCRVDSRTTRYGDPYRVITLSTAYEQLDAYLWPAVDVDPDSLAKASVVKAALEPRELGGRRFHALLDMERVNPQGVRGIAMLPRAACADCASLEAMLEILLDLPPCLTDFVAQVMTGDLGMQFVTVPASYSFHHACASGLLTHSVDCAQRFRLASDGFNDDEVAVGTVAALLHDVGKARTLDSRGRNTALGRMVSHEALTLEVCAHALSELEGQWAWAAYSLRNVWMWRVGPNVDWRKQPSLAIAVQAADRLSSELNKREGQAFTQEVNTHAAR